MRQDAAFDKRLALLFDERRHARPGVGFHLGRKRLKPLLRHPTVPDVVNETWAGVLGPAGLPARFVGRLNRGITEIAGSPELRAILDPDGMLPAPTTSSAYAARIKHELATWKRVAASRKIVAE